MFYIMKKIDELDGTNDRLLKYCKENIEKYKKMWYNAMWDERNAVLKKGDSKIVQAEKASLMEGEKTA